MILDKRSLLSDKQVITGSALSTSSYDFLAEQFDYQGKALATRKGIAEKIPLYIGVNANFDALTSLDIQLQESDTVDGAGDLNGTISTILTVNVLLADLIAGYIFPVDKLPRKVTKRFLQFNYVVNGANPTVGSITAGFVPHVDGMNKSGF